MNSLKPRMLFAATGIDARPTGNILLKIAGPTLGPFGVDNLLAYWADPPAWPVCLASLDDVSLETLRGKLRVQAWIVSLTLPADNVTAARLPAIREVLAQAGVFGNGSASGKRALPSACQAVRDYRALLSAPEVVECKAAKPASAAVASSVGESDGLVTAGPTDWQVVPA